MNKAVAKTHANQVYQYVDLGRTFHELSSYAGGSDDVDISQVFRRGTGIGWDSLKKDFRVIILSEAGSGKTEEIRHAARTLVSEGKAVFFLRLEHIPTDFEDAFEVGTYEKFKEWLDSGNEGWLLLDSVDEARLKSPRDFELAIRKLSRFLSTAKDRTHIIITGRTAAWRPKTDLAICSEHFPYTLSSISEPDSQKGNSEGEFEKTTNVDEQQSAFRIFALDDLKADQIEHFAKAKGISDSGAFLEAVERADAWSFTARPQDLEEIIEFWIDEGRIGSRLEIMRNSIGRRLSERDQTRADTRPLASERARHGARLLAAATTLTQDPTIRVPDGADNSKGIPIQSVLSDWDEREHGALLSRPIFDGAIYGSVRFHHRSVREYLTAEWFYELLKNETSRRLIEALFFRNQYGIDIIVPKLRPILPWLAILDAKIRERVRKIAPEVIFEGGDPSQLPLDIRSNILTEVCEQISTGVTNRSAQDYAAVQRFSNTDLSDDIRNLLRTYRNNDNVLAFLLRMVWLGKVRDVLPEAMEIALSPASEEYVRKTAFRAVKAIGSSIDQERIRECILNEGSEIRREWLAEILDKIKVTAPIIDWLLKCIEKCAPHQKYSVDYLSQRVKEVSMAADISLLPQLTTGLNRLLETPPVVERRYCEVSTKFQWLMEAASKAAERLVEARHEASFDVSTLGILHKFKALQGYAGNELSDVKSNLSKTVPVWIELNRRLFWFEVNKHRDQLDHKGKEKLNYYWQVSVFGSFWKFEETDFDYVVDQIKGQALLDNKMVALSLSFSLYRDTGRPRKWRERLKRITKDNVELSEQLSIFLNPPTQTPEMRRHRERQKKWKQQDKAHQEKKENYHSGWAKYLSENLSVCQNWVRSNPGKLSNSLLYLFDKLRDGKGSSGKWTEYNWEKLIPEYGSEVAKFYRDSAVGFWRVHNPQLRSEGAELNQTTLAEIFGLSGLEIESIEIANWAYSLSSQEVELACRYASFELNGFPVWFPKLFEAHKEIVGQFLVKEIRYELSIEMPDVRTHYIIDDVSWSGQWAWDYIADSVFDILKSSEPVNLFNLNHLINILSGSNISSRKLGELAAEKCLTVKSSENVARWFAVWTGTDPASAVPALNEHIRGISDKNDQTLFAMIYLSHLLGDRRDENGIARDEFKTPTYLKSIYLIMNEYVRHSEDINRAGTGVYSPELRDDAQEARNKLFNILNKISGKEAFLAIMDIAQAHPDEAARPWMLLHAKTKATQDGDIEPWTLPQVKDFNEKLVRTPGNHRELAELAVLRLLDLKDELEHGDTSIAGILKGVELETDMRKYIGKELRDKALNRYSASQEEELADAKKPDFRFVGVGFDGPVPAELKLADKWSGPDLFERLENQLCGDYLRDRRSNRGIFLLVTRGKKVGWDIPDSSNRVDFTGLIDALQRHWSQISPKFPKIDDIAVIGIDLTIRKA